VGSKPASIRVKIVKSKETIVQQIGSEKVLEENIGEIRMRS
jgi:hypothetical protein